MATKDIRSGLLSKVARFVRNPTKDWSELDIPEPEPEPESGTGYDKKALKEMIERKRRNDFVRQREFDQLRQLQRNRNLIGAGLAGHPSLFQGITTSNFDERAITLKKIDEIEAQMSKQWWKGKNGQTSFQEGSLPSADERPRSGDGTATPSVAPGTSANMFSYVATAELGSNSGAGQNLGYESTQMGQAVAEELAALGNARQVSGVVAADDQNPASGSGEYGSAKLRFGKLDDALDDPNLEEAAIRFANGDDKGVEETLLAALQAEQVDPALAARWAAALFDFYRATAQPSSFDRFALDYVQRFGRSALAAIPSSGSHKTRLPEAQRSSINTSTNVWDCPQELDLSTVLTLPDILARIEAGATWRLNWSRLNGITADAAKALAQLFDYWCTQAVRLHFDGADVLGRRLKDCTPSGRKEVALFWWQLRFDALRLMRRHDEFELAALDYCVTYEVSPPPWIDPRCDYADESMMATTPLAAGQAIFDDTEPADFDQALTVPAGLDSLSEAELELAGELLGDATAALDKFKTERPNADRIVISCERLIRVDFAAAGSILNWVTARESEGCVVQFRAVPLLVAAFFNVIGINEHAQLRLRTSF